MNIEWLVKQFIISRLTPEEVKKNLLEGGIDGDLVDQAFAEFRKLTGNKKWLTPPPMLVEDKDNKNNWYPGADSMVDSRFWPHLKDHLLTAKRWTPEAVQSIDDASDRIVAWLQSPWASSIKTRGLVVGYIQSGKTANFTAVIAKAADAGYRFFIILSGTKTSLRSQTQERLDRELIQLNPANWFSPTAQSDFQLVGSKADFFLAEKKYDKMLCVVKKNATILKKLIAWLKGASPDVLRRCPFLIIDDEADEASINTAKNQANTDPENRDRTAINRHLVSLLNMLPKAAYIGYTATPFASVLIDPRPGDLYPRDFIVALPKPDGHFGTEKIFGRDRLLQDDTDEEYKGLDMVRIIPQEELPDLKPPTNDHSFEPTVTPSLREALHYFWMATAARIAREQGSDHSTMLIHTTQLITVHNNTRDEIERYRKRFLGELRGTNANGEFIRLSKQWDEEKKRVSSTDMGYVPVEFEQLWPYLLSAIERTEVVVDNSRSQYRLSYDGDAKIQIAIGGNTLSRGLTLEGLLVSFFVRAANTYDTLLQMGRWFGYRPGYADLPRMWMTAELKGYFFDLATIEAEIRRDVENYALRGITPSEFGIRIRTHPDLAVTAVAKMQHAVPAKISYDGHPVQTVLFDHLNAKWLEQNITATDSFIAKLVQEGLKPTDINGHKIFYQVPASEVITFLQRYQFHSNSRELASKLLVTYIRSQNRYGLLKHWNVAVRGVINKKARSSIRLGNLEVPLLERARREFPRDYAHIGVLMSKGDIGADLNHSSQTQETSVEQIVNRRKSEWPGMGLLLIYPISKDSEPGTGATEKVSLGAAENIIGLGLVFPPASEKSRGTQDYITIDPNKLDHTEFELDEEEDEDA